MNLNILTSDHCSFHTKWMTRCTTSAPPIGKIIPPIFIQGHSRMWCNVTTIHFQLSLTHWARALFSSFSCLYEDPPPMCLQVQALVGHWYNSYGWHGDLGYLLMQLTCVLWSCLSPILDVTFPCCYGLMLSLSYFMTWQFRKNPTHNV